MVAGGGGSFCWQSTPPKGLVRDKKKKVTVSVDWLMKSQVRIYQEVGMKTRRDLFLQRLV